MTSQTIFCVKSVTFQRKERYGVTLLSCACKPFFSHCLSAMLASCCKGEDISYSEAYLQIYCIGHHILGLRMDCGWKDYHIKKPKTPTIKNDTKNSEQTWAQLWIKKPILLFLFNLKIAFTVFVTICLLFGLVSFQRLKTYL